MHIWQLQEAKARLTELVKEAQREPQVISCHGGGEVVVISIQEYNRAFKQEENIVSFFQHSPLYGENLDFSRDKFFLRKIDFFEDNKK